MRRQCAPPLTLDRGEEKGERGDKEGNLCDQNHVAPHGALHVTPDTPPMDLRALIGTLIGRMTKNML